MKLLLFILFLIVLVSVPLFEQITINKIRRTKKTPYLLNENIKIHYEINKGMMMGICKNRRSVVLAITTLLLSILFLFTLYILLKKEGLIIFKIGLIFLTSGSFSNALERYIYKHVVDYISFPNFFIKKIRNVIFNVADLCIFVGSLITIIGALFI